MEAMVLRKMYRRMIKSFLDILILTELGNSPMSGYDVISFIHKKFRILISSGTVYSLLYSLERNGLIEGRWNQRRRVYILTEKGEETIKILLSANDKIKAFMTNILQVKKGSGSFNHP